MNDRKLWVQMLDKIARPVLSALAEDRLKETFPLWDEEEPTPEHPRTIAYLEAQARLLHGIAPWLDAEVSDPEERALQAEYRVMAQKALHNCICPNSKDYIEWWDGTREASQHLVEAYNFAYPVLVSPKTFWETLPEEDKQYYVRALTRVNHRRPIANNWRMFTATIEAALYKMTGECDTMRVQFALMEHDLAYRGDGIYADGTPFSWDSYSSSVMAPLMMLLSGVLTPAFQAWNYGETLHRRSVARLGALCRKLECMLAEDGSYPALGRSLCGRNWMFSLSFAAFRHCIPKDIPLGRVRTELTANLQKFFNAPTFFDSKGYIRIGLYGYQPAVADSYLTRGSMYCFLDVFAALGLSDTDEFWSVPAEPSVWKQTWGEGTPCPATTAQEERKLWLSYLDKVSRPVLSALAQGKLKQTLPAATVAPYGGEERIDTERIPYAPLEAFARTVCGIAPWLELDLPDGEEKALQAEYRLLAAKAVDMATDPASPDYMLWWDEKKGPEPDQPLVEHGFFALALCRAPRALYFNLPERVQQNVIAVLLKGKKIRPPTANWLLFASMIDGALYRLTGDGDAMRIEAGLVPVNNRYLGDGTYGDGIYANGKEFDGAFDKGKVFEWSYYNSFVLHPFMDELLDVAMDMFPGKYIENLRAEETKRLGRYAAVLERMVAPDGSYPPTGRSLTYRAGAFQALSLAALKGKLREEVEPSQARRAITAAIHRTLSPTDTFDENGFLQVGICGKQPRFAETYISTGSLYLCTTAFLALGLAPDNAFWNNDAPTTWEKMWSGVNMKGDHAVW